MVYFISTLGAGCGKEPARETTCRQVPPAGWVESAMKKLDEEPIRNSKKVQETECDGQSQKKKGTELRVTVRRPLKETKNQREVPSKETQVGPSGKMELKLWPKRSALGRSVG